MIGWFLYDALTILALALFMAFIACVALAML